MSGLTNTLESSRHVKILSTATRKPRRSTMMPLDTWVPFRPDDKDLEAIANDVAEISDIQRRLVEKHDDLKMPDRVAHQYQIAGGKVALTLADKIPQELEGVGIFEPGSKYICIGRVSGGLGWPHVETYPDILGIMLAVQTRGGERVDFLGISDPAAPAGNHRDFMDVLYASAEAAGADFPLAGHPDDVGDLIAAKAAFAAALTKRMGFFKGLTALAHLARQSFRSFSSSTAYDTYWTDVVEVGNTAGKFIFAPTTHENRGAAFRKGERHLTEDWRRRQTRGSVDFGLCWLPFRNQQETPTTDFTRKWREQHMTRIGTVTFPQIDPESEEARLWAALASEIGANQGNWIHGKGNTITEPATEFGVARKIAYQKSQDGRDALKPDLYRSVFETGEISPDLARELRRRRSKKESAGHVSWAPGR